MAKFFFSPLWDCDSSCLFCAKGKAPAGVKRRYTLRECLAILARRRREGFDELSLDGGEPTLLPYLPGIIAGAYKLGYRSVMLLTNASPLAEPERARALAAAADGRPRGRDFGICVSLHSHRRSVAEALSGSKGSFDRTMRGLRNLREAGLGFGLYHVITALSYRTLPEFAAFVLAELPPVRSVTFSYIYPVTHNLKHMGLYPRLSAVQPHFARAVAALQAGGVQVRLGSCGVIPLCLLGGNERLFTDSFMRDGRRSSSTDSLKTEAFPFFSELFNRQSKVKGPACAACALDPVCGGVWNFYAESYGTGELKPYGRDYFAGLPARRGTARLGGQAPGRYEDALGADLVRLLDLRFAGWGRARFTARAPGSPGAERLRVFAESIGYSRVYFGHAA